MRWGNSFTAAVHLIFAAFIVLLGLFMAMLPWAPHFKTLAIEFLQGQSLAAMLWLGIIVMVIGLALILGLFVMYRRSYYHLKMGESRVEVSDELIHGYVEMYWKSLFPHHQIPSLLTLRKDNALEITADLPYIEHPKREELLLRVEKELKEVLARAVGYEKPFYMRVSFESNSSL
jgi:hypothetical protein